MEVVSTELRSCDCCVGTTTSERSDDLGGASTVGTTTEPDDFGVLCDLLLSGDFFIRESRTVLSLSTKDGLGGVDGVCVLEPFELLELLVLVPVLTLLVRVGVLSPELSLL